MYISHLTEQRGPTPPSGKVFPVVHIWLDDAHRDALKQALDPYVTGRKNNRSGLKALLRDERYFPQSILHNLEALRDEKNCRRVFVLHNLPEIPAQDVAGTSLNDRELLQNLMLKESYAVYISDGVGQAIGLKPSDNGSVNSLFALARYSNDSSIDGSDLHKHNETVTTLSGVYSHGESTRFTDWESLLHEAATDPKIGAIEVSYGAKPAPVRLADFECNFPRWQRQDNIEICATPEHEQAFEALLNRHSQHVQLHNGDMVLWSNDGPILHQALPSERGDEAKVTLRRVAVGRAMNRA